MEEWKIQFNILDLRSFILRMAAFVVQPIAFCSIGTMAQRFSLAGAPCALAAFASWRWMYHWTTIRNLKLLRFWKVFKGITVFSLEAQLGSFRCRFLPTDLFDFIYFCFLIMLPSLFTISTLYFFQGLMSTLYFWRWWLIVLIILFQNSMLCLGSCFWCWMFVCDKRNFYCERIQEHFILQLFSPSSAPNYVGLSIAIILHEHFILQLFSASSWPSYVGLSIIIIQTSKNTEYSTV